MKQALPLFAPPFPPKPFPLGAEFDLDAVPDYITMPTMTDEQIERAMVQECHA